MNMISLIASMDYIRNYIIRLHDPVITRPVKGGLSKIKGDVMHSVRQFIHILFMFVLLGLTLVYLIPAGPV